MPEKTLSIIRREAEKRGMDADALIERTARGFDEYGSANHLRADFRAWQEVLEELEDAFNLTCMAKRRGDGYPTLATAMLDGLEELIAIARSGALMHEQIHEEAG